MKILRDFLNIQGDFGVYIGMGWRMPTTVQDRKPENGVSFRVHSDRGTTGVVPRFYSIYLNKDVYINRILC